MAQKTISDFEKERSTPRSVTLERLKSALEFAGVEFTEAIENACGPGVRFKWGVSTGEKFSGSGIDVSGGSDPTLDALADAGFEEDVLGDRDLFLHWRDRTEEWTRLSPEGRLALLEAMGLSL